MFCRRTNLLLTLSIVSILAASYGLLPDRAQADELPENKRTEASGSAPAGRSSAKPPSFNKGDVVTLENIRDLGMCLMQIQQQARNIFMEATREPVPETANPLFHCPDEICDDHLHNVGDYLPTRPEWLTFYVGTLEPIIHLFRDEVNDSAGSSKVIMVPKGTAEQFEKLLASYDKDVVRLNDALSEIYENIDAKDNNLDIARSAVALYKVANDMEKTRVQAFDLIKNAKNRGEYDKIQRPSK